MNGFLSYALHRVDKKGRVSVPALYRDVLGGMKSEFICFPALLGPWLQAVTPQQMQAFMSQQDRLGAFGGEIAAYPTLIFSQAISLNFDTDGRTILPAEFLAHARIDEEIAFVGQGHYFSMWSPVLFEAEKSRLRDRAMSDRASWVTPVMVDSPSVATNITADGAHG